jgi:hypothetical protein
MIGATCWLSAARLACTLATALLAKSAALAALSAVFALSVEVEAGGGGAAESGACAGSSARADAFEAAACGDALPPGPHAASMMVAITTGVALASDCAKGRLCMCASGRGRGVGKYARNGSAHSFARLEERMMKSAKTFARDEFSFANVMDAYAGRRSRRFATGCKYQIVSNTKPRKVPIRQRIFAGRSARQGIWEIIRCSGERLILCLLVCNPTSKFRAFCPIETAKSFPPKSFGTISNSPNSINCRYLRTVCVRAC